MGLLNERLLRFIQMLLEVLHEGCAACSHCRGIACMGLVLAMDITVGVADVNLTKLCEEIDAGAIGGPEIGVAEFPITQLPARDGVASGNIRRSSKHPNSAYFENWTAKA